MPKKIKANIGILFGGKSAEHDVSLLSAQNVYAALNKTKYNPILIRIDKTGKWLLNNVSDFLTDPYNKKSIRTTKSNDVITITPQYGGEIYNPANQKKKLKIDVVFPILHGPFGEDGTVQGLLKLANIPFIGSSVLGSAIGMDKDVMKRLLRDANIPIGKFIVHKSHETTPDFKKITKELGLPFFIKPANMGSSVGVSKIHNEHEYKKSVVKALYYDAKIILEQYIQGREIECSVLGNENPIASVLGEVTPSHDFYSYDAKYVDDKGATLEIPAKISDKIAKKMQIIAIKTFQCLSCEGLGRVDFFLKNNGEIIVNEINTIPGFTKNSMYPKLWEASGIAYSELIDKLVQLAIERFNKERNLKTDIK